jgi:hypothetical protein
MISSPKQRKLTFQFDRKNLTSINVKDFKTMMWSNGIATLKWLL